MPPPETLPTRARPHRLSPKKLLLSKWTAVHPVGKEKHFVVTRVVEPEAPGVTIESVELQAVHSGRSTTLPWRSLSDRSHWHRGWL